MEFRTLNPATEELVKEYPYIDNSVLSSKINASKAAFEEWRKVSFQERKKYFHKLADLLDKEQERLAQSITLEMGKPVSQAKGEVRKCAWVCRHYADYAENFLKDQHKDLESTDDSIITFEPLGIIYAIMPWNFPYWQFFRYAAPALMAGNVTLLKHAENVPECALNIEELFKKAEFPDTIMQNLFITHEQSNQVIQSPAVQGITLTGSSVAGSKVAAEAGKNIKKTVLELGGSDPFIVLDDANVSKAAQTAAIARLQNTGQSCIASKRFIIYNSIKDKFLEEFQQAFSTFKTGDPTDESINLGSLAREDLVEKLDRQVQESIKQGAKAIIGGKKMEGKGFYYEPTILTNIKAGMPAYEEELFGPVASVFEVQNEEEAINLANDTIYGLGASIWTKSSERGKRVGKEIRTGSIAINGMVKSDPRLPFGGVKSSGYGRELSEFGIREFVNVKTVNVF